MDSKIESGGVVKLNRGVFAPQPIPLDFDRKHTVYLNGVPESKITILIDGKPAKIQMIEIANEGLGSRHLYAFMSENYDDPSLPKYDMVFREERKGGGTICLICAITAEGKRLIALSLEDRKNLNGEGWYLPGRFAKVGESRADTTKRVTEVEVGIEAIEAVSVDCLGLIDNRAYAIGDPHQGIGIHASLQKIPMQLIEPADQVELEARGATMTFDCWKLIDNCIQFRNSRMVRFFREEDLRFVTGDMFALAAAEITRD